MLAAIELPVRIWEHLSPWMQCALAGDRRRLGDLTQPIADVPPVSKRPRRAGRARVVLPFSLHDQPAFEWHLSRIRSGVLRHLLVGSRQFPSGFRRFADCLREVLAVGRSVRRHWVLHSRRLRGWVLAIGGCEFVVFLRLGVKSVGFRPVVSGELHVIGR